MILSLQIPYMQLAYEQFKENVERKTNGASAVNDRPPHIEVWFLDSFQR